MYLSLIVMWYTVPYLRVTCIYDYFDDFPKVVNLDYMFPFWWFGGCHYCLIVPILALGANDRMVGNRICFGPVVTLDVELCRFGGLWLGVLICHCIG